MNNTVSRRSFLAHAAAGILGASVLSPRHGHTIASASRILGANDTIRIGLIGCGHRGSHWMAEVARREEARENVCLAAVGDIYEPHKVRAQSLSGAELHHRWEDLVVRADLDAVVIATPDHWHAPMAIAAMNAGKDVYCEPPMARTAAEARAVHDCAAATGRVLQIGAAETSEAQWRIARDIVAEGKIGKVLWAQPAAPAPTPTQPCEPSASARSDDLGLSVSARVPACRPDGVMQVRPSDLDWPAFLGDAPQRPFSPERFVHWRRFWDYSDGVAAEAFYPKLAALLIALGPEFPERVSAAGGVYQEGARETPDMFVMTAEYPAGHTIVLTSSAAKSAASFGVIRGETGALYCEGRRVRLLREDDGAVVFDQCVDRQSEMTSSDVGFRAHVTDWLECIRTRGQCVCGSDIGYQAATAVAMAIEAYRRRKTLVWNAEREQHVISPPRRIT